MDFAKVSKQYIDDVMNGRELVSKLTRKTVERHLKDLEEAHEHGWYFDEAAAVKVMKFFALLKHTKGRKHARKPFVLRPWQCFIIWVLFGWYKSSDETRRFSTAYVEIAKKNGKTAYAGGIADFLLCMDDEPEAEVYCAATKKDQAKICFNQAKAYIEKNTDLMKYTGARFVTNNVAIEKTGSKMEPLGRDSYGLDGINPYAAIIDEYHEWPKDDVRDSIESAIVSRIQYLIFIITTAGYNKTWPCFEYRSFIIDILDGAKIQDDTFGMIFTLDDDDDWKDECNWPKANPNYGVSVEPDKMREQFKKALNRGGRAEVTFKTKNLNIWVDAPETWISDEIIMDNNYGITLAELKGQECYGGLDLASHVDINALELYFPNVKGRPRVLSFFWVPEAKVIEREDRVDYRRWVEDKLIFMTDGNIIDIDTQVDDISKIIPQFNIKAIGFDPAKAYHGVVQGLQKAGFHKLLVEYKQDKRNMSAPVREMERALLNTEIDLMGNPVMRWMFRNTVTYTDINDNIKLDKKKSIDKIDGVVALANAIGTYMSLTADAGPAPYSNHTLRVLKNE